MYELTRILVILGWCWLVIVGVFIAGYEWALRARRRDAEEAAGGSPGKSEPFTAESNSAHVPSRDRPKR